MTAIKVGGHKPIKIANDWFCEYVKRYTENKILLTTELNTSTSGKGILRFLFVFIDINIKISK